MTPLDAWLRGLSSDSCGVFRGAWATDAANPLGIDTMAASVAVDRIISQLDAEMDALTDAIADQRRGEVVGRWSGEA